MGGFGLNLGAVAADHLARPRNRGPLLAATHIGLGGNEPGDGPFVRIWLRVEGGVIQEAAFQSHGCPSSVAAASVLCSLITKRELDKALTLTADELIAVMGGIPEGKEIYAKMAIDALRSASAASES